MSDDDDKFDKFEGWAVIEMMGHRRVAGFVREVTIAGAGFLRIDVPRANGDGYITTQYVPPSSLYCLTPTTKEKVMQEAVVAQRPAYAWGEKNSLPAHDEEADGQDGRGGFVECEWCDERAVRTCPCGAAMCDDHSDPDGGSHRCEACAEGDSAQPELPLGDTPRPCWDPECENESADVCRECARAVCAEHDWAEDREGEPPLCKTCHDLAAERLAWTQPEAAAPAAKEGE